MSSSNPSAKDSDESPTWVPECKPPGDAGAATALSAHLLSQLGDSDCTFQAGDGSDTVFRLHRLVVTQSPVFRGMLCGGFKEAVEMKPVVLQDCTLSTLKIAFGFMYGQGLDMLSLEAAFDVLEFAHRFDIESLFAAAGNMVTKLLRKENCVEIMVRARFYGAVKVSSSSHRFFVKNFIQFGDKRMDDEIKRMDAEDIRGIGREAARMGFSFETRKPHIASVTCESCDNARHNCTHHANFKRTVRLYNGGGRLLCLLNIFFVWQGDDASQTRISAVTDAIMAQSFDRASEENLKALTDLMDQNDGIQVHSLAILKRVTNDVVSRNWWYM